MRRNFSSLFHHLLGNEPFFFPDSIFLLLESHVPTLSKWGVIYRKLSQFIICFPKNSVSISAMRTTSVEGILAIFDFFLNLNFIKEWRDSFLIFTFHKKMKKTFENKEGNWTFSHWTLKKRFFIKEMQFDYSPFYPSSFIWDLRFSHLNSLFSLHHISASYNCIK